MALPVGCASHLGVGVGPNSWLKARPATRLGGAVAGDGQTQFTGAGSRTSDTRWGIVFERRPLRRSLRRPDGAIDEASSIRHLHNNASTTEPSMLPHRWRCRLAGAGTGGSGANHRQVSPGGRVLAADAATSRGSMGPMDDNQAAQACFEPRRCRLARRFAHERDEMDRQTARITGEQCARGLAADVWLDVGLRRCGHIWHALMGQPEEWDPWTNHSPSSGAASSPIDTHNLTIWRTVGFGDWAPRQSADLLLRGDCSRGDSMPATQGTLPSASPSRVWMPVSLPPQAKGVTRGQGVSGI